MKLTHTDTSGAASMVDVGDKPPLTREAVATSFIALAPATLKLIQENGMKKGDVLAVARIAGIQAAKQTQHLIPLCHQVPLTKAGVEFAFEDAGIRITAVAKCIGQTGVEMEALTAANIAALTIYDMCKAVDKEMVISELKLVSKTKK